MTLEEYKAHVEATRKQSLALALSLLKKEENELREDGYISEKEKSFDDDQDNELYNKR